MTIRSVERYKGKERLVSIRLGLQECRGFPRKMIHGMLAHPTHFGPMHDLVVVKIDRMSMGHGDRMVKPGNVVANGP